MGRNLKKWKLFKQFKKFGNKKYYGSSPLSGLLSSENMNCSWFGMQKMETNINCLNYGKMSWQQILFAIFTYCVINYKKLSYHGLQGKLKNFK